MKLNFYNRYIEGDHEKVTKELYHLSYLLKYSDFRNEAFKVLNELIDRIIFNTQKIVQKLKLLNYKFEYPDKVLKVPTSKNKEEHFENTYQKIEEYGFYIPVIMKLIHSKIEYIYLQGEFPVKNHPFNEYYSDPLIIEPFSEFKITAKHFQPVELLNQPTQIQSIFFSPDYYTKANVSGDAYYLEVPPSRKIDARLSTRFMDGWKRQFTLIDYLRLSFKYGGFPGFAFYENIDSSTQKILTNLTTDLKLI